MSRHQGHPNSARGAGSSRGRLWLPAVLAASLALSFLPARWSGWVGQLSRLVVIPTAPLSGWILGMSRSVLSPPEPARAEELKLLEEEKQAFETLYLRELAESRRLREVIRELQSGLAFNPDARVRQVFAPVVGTSADLSSGLLSVRAGVGVLTDTSTVATTTGLQLVGRVTSSSGPTCWVMPITRRNAGKIRVAIVTGDGVPEIGANLIPQGDGTLRGDVLRIAGPADAAVPQAETGQIVRLDDLDWPASSRMLIVGRVERIEPSPDDPLRTVIIVRPTLNIERVAEVLLRVQSSETEAGGGGS